MKNWLFFTYMQALNMVHNSEFLLTMPTNHTYYCCVLLPLHMLELDQYR